MTLPAPTRLGSVDQARFLDRSQAVRESVRKTVTEIMADVRKGGDAALRKWTRELDGADLEDPWLDAATWDAALEQVPATVQGAVLENMARIESFHARQVLGEDAFEVAPGIMLGRRPVPFEAVACYVPGGRASYPSTVLMTVTLARLAGVARIIVATPPRPDGSVDPAVLFAARAAGATDILRAGGAQAVAALAYGTDSVPNVQAIVGPGNVFVTAAKQAVAADGRVWTDAPAGPSELLVLADSSADADAVALDLMAQAEHDPEAQCLLVTDDPGLAERVARSLADQVPEATRRDIIEESLSRHGALLVASSWDEAVTFADAYAAEHLELQCREPRLVLERIHNAGSVFLGPHAPVTLGDYGSGTNHVLPTMGMARIRGGLCIDDFRKWVTWQEVTQAGLAAIAPAVTALARAEGLEAHAAAVEGRL